MMACRTVLRSVFLSEQWRPFPFPFPGQSHSLASASPHPSPRLSFGVRFRAFNGAPLRCSHGEIPSPSSSPQDDQEPPQEAVLKAISEVSKSEGRVAQTTNVVMGGTVTDDSTNEWLALDQKVNSYPTVRGFTAIGTGGDDFVQAMVVAVESVLEQPIPETLSKSRGSLEGCLSLNCITNKGRVTQKLSSRGKYVSVNIGPIRVVSSEQVQAIYNAMKRDDRMKYFL